jgi:small conductance mechanosensitive channel
MFVHLLNLGGSDVLKLPATRAETLAQAEWMADTARRLSVEWGLRLVGALILLVVTWIVSAWLRSVVLRAINRPRVDQTFGRFLGNLVRWLIIGTGLIACLGVFGVNTTSLAAMVGAAGLAIGLALQGSLSNLAAGIMLLFLRPFKVGDFIQVGSVMGTVYEVELFTLKLNAPDNRRIILPNNQVFSSVIENHTHNPLRRADVTIGIDYAADTARTRQVLMEAVTSIEGVLSDPPPDIYLNDLGASSVNWRVSGWCASSNFGTVKQAICEAVKRELETAGIAIPFPQLDVRLHRATPTN